MLDQINKQKFLPLREDQFSPRDPLRFEDEGVLVTTWDKDGKEFKYTAERMEI